MPMKDPHLEWDTPMYRLAVAQLDRTATRASNSPIVRNNFPNCGSTDQPAAAAIRAFSQHRATRSRATSCESGFSPNPRPAAEKAKDAVAKQS